MKRAGTIGSLPIAREFDEVEKEVRLWRAVVDQAIADYLTESTEKRDLKYKREAKVWLRGNTKDFYDVCFLSCIEPIDMKRFIFEIITEEELYD